MSDNKIALSEETEHQIVEVANESLELVIVDNDSYSRAGELLVSHEALKKVIVAKFKTPKSKAHDSWKEIVAWEKEEIARLTPSITNLNKQMTAWVVEQEKLRKAEEARLLREAEKKAEEEQLAAAVEAEAQGDSEEAGAILEEPVFTPPPVVEKSVPKVSGQTMSTTWRYKITDLNKIPRQYMIPDEKALNALVKAQKERTNVPGIKAYPEHKMRGVRQ